MEVTLKYLNLENNGNPELYNKYCGILNTFLNLISYEDIHSIILCGSFAKQKLTVGSDIDLVIIGNNKLKDIVVDGIEIGIISYEKQELLQEIKKEENSFIRKLSSLVGDGISIYGEEFGGTIISLGKDIYQSKVPVLSSDTLDKISHFIDRNRILSKSYLNRHDELAFYSRMSFSVQQGIQNYFKLNKQAIPDWKRTSIGIGDYTFNNALIGFFEGKNKQEKYDSFLIILDILEKLISQY